VLTLPFDDLVNADRVLSGQYPSGVADWGGSGWYLSSPWGRFTTNSVSFNGSGLTSATLTFVVPRRLVRLDAYNGGTTTATVSLTCDSRPPVQLSLAAGQLSTFSTNWTTTCVRLTIGSTNGWHTNFDDLVIDGGPT
jgi:hypothetical protein